MPSDAWMRMSISVIGTRPKAIQRSSAAAVSDPAHSLISGPPARARPTATSDEAIHDRVMTGRRPRHARPFASGWLTHQRIPFSKPNEHVRTAILSAASTTEKTPKRSGP